MRVCESSYKLQLVLTYVEIISVQQIHFIPAPLGRPLAHKCRATVPYLPLPPHCLDSPSTFLLSLPASIISFSVFDNLLLSLHTCVYLLLCFSFSRAFTLYFAAVRSVSPHSVSFSRILLALTFLLPYFLPFPSFLLLFFIHNLFSGILLSICFLSSVCLLFLLFLPIFHLFLLSFFLLFYFLLSSIDLRSFLYFYSLFNSSEKLFFSPFFHCLFSLSSQHPFSSLSFLQLTFTLILSRSVYHSSSLYPSLLLSATNLLLTLIL